LNIIPFRVESYFKNQNYLSVMIFIKNMTNLDYFQIEGTLKELKELAGLLEKIIINSFDVEWYDKDREKSAYELRIVKMRDGEFHMSPTIVSIKDCKLKEGTPLIVQEKWATGANYITDKGHKISFSYSALNSLE
jgi:hypothetical protein